MNTITYPTTRPFANRYSKRTGYLVNRNSKFYKTLLAFDLAQLPIAEIQVESHCFYTNQQISFKGSYRDLLGNYDAWSLARRLIEQEHRWGKGPLRITDLGNDNVITQGNDTKVSMFFSRGESSNDKLIIVWEAA